MISSRAPGESLLNPFDIEGLRDFNLFYVMVGLIGGILNRMSWSGTQGYNAAAINAHEQKMAGVLGGWRSGFSTTMFVLLAVVAFAFLNNSKFATGNKGASACRNVLAVKVFDDVASEANFDAVRDEYKKYLATGNISQALQTQIDRVKAEEADEAIKAGKDEAGQEEENATKTEPQLTVGKGVLKTISKEKAQTFGTIFGQMRVPMAINYILPIGLTGAFCALCIFLLISTDTTYMHSWGSIIVQDLILPIRGRPFTPKQQIFLLRLTIACVAVFAFFFSFFFGQVTYIVMFQIITGAIWLGGAGPCIVGGLYWKRGTSAGAWGCLISGSTLAILGIVGQKCWVGTIYPWIVQNGLLETVTTTLEGISAPFEPWIKWRVTPDQFPINGQEIYAITMLTSLSLYIGLSLLTSRKPHNMDRLLHRGEYRREGKVIEKQPRTIKSTLLGLIGINEEYSKGDKIIAWSVFIYSFGWCFLVSFVVIVIWNKINPWSNNGWANCFFINRFAVTGAIAVATTIWFTIGGAWDLRRLFKRLKEKETNVLDDGRVIDNVSADDVAIVEAVEHTIIEEAHREEALLEEALEKEHDETDIDNLHDHQKGD